MIILRLIGCLWSLPVTLLGLAVVAFCSPYEVTSRPWVLEFRVRRWLPGFGAATFGHVQLYPEDPAPHRAHEDVHTLQGDILGPLNAIYFVFAAALFGWSLAVGRGWSDAVWRAYWWNPLEVWARKASGE